MLDGLVGLLRPGCRVWLGDGVSLPLDALPVLADAARTAGEVELVLGWCPVPDLPLDLTAFASVRSFMGGYGLRRGIDRGAIRYVPVRLGMVPSLIAGALRPDVVVASVRPGPGGHHLTTESAWIWAALEAGAVIAGVERPALPLATSGPALPPDQVVIVGASDAPPLEYRVPAPGDDHLAVGAQVARLVPAGARIQYGPGQITDAAVAAIQVPVHVDTGMLSDAALRLEQRGLLLGPPSAPYLAGTPELYDWADGRGFLHRLEHTHHPGRLSEPTPPLVAINTAIEIDAVGQVNVESTGTSLVGGVGGQPDFAGAAARSRDGISIIALLSHRAGVPNLVERLSAPASTPRHDVEVVATERGIADLRGLDDTERRAALERLWS